MCGGGMVRCYRTSTQQIGPLGKLLNLLIRNEKPGKEAFGGRQSNR